MRFFDHLPRRAAAAGVFVLLLLAAPAPRADEATTTDVLTSSAWWVGAQEFIRAREYEITWQERAGALHAANRASNLRVYFRERGVEMMPRTGARDWRMTFTLTHFGREDRLEPLAPVRPTAEGRRVEYRRHNISEWYVNRPRGIEQGYFIPAPPPGEGAVRIEGRLSGDLEARLVDESVSFVRDNEEVMSCGKLVVTDADGRTLSSRLTVDGNTLGIVIDDEGTYPITVDPLFATPWSVESNQASCNFGWSVAGAGDVNNDTYADVIVGAPFYDSGESNEGIVFAYYGGPTGLPAGASWAGESNQADAWFGTSVASAGDVNNDNFSDIIVGAPAYTSGEASEGWVFVWYGGAGGLGVSGTPANADWTAESNQAFSGFGGCVAAAGDVNGDTWGDVIVGARAYNNGEANEGAVFVWHGSAAGLGASGTPANANWMAESDQAQANFGVSAASAGDVNNDTYSDVIVGADSYDNGESNEGRAFVWYGSASGLGTNGIPANADWTAESNQADAFFGGSVAGAGDVNNDTYSDVIVGAYAWSNGQAGEGGAFVWHGSGSGLAPFGMPGNADWTGESNQAGADYGRSVASAGDVDVDGYSDVVVGANRYSNGETEEGRGYCYLGGAGGLATAATWTGESNQAFAWFGWSIAGAGDVNGDNFSDVIVGIRSWSNPQVEEGRATVYHGNPDIVPVTLQGYASRWTGTHVEVTWTLFDDADAAFTDVTFVVRRRAGAGAYETIPSPNVSRSQNRFVFNDWSAGPKTTYRYRVEILEGGEAVGSFETVASTPSLGFSLSQNHPNPFNPSTRIEFMVERDSRISLRVYDAAGKLVTTLVNRWATAGPYVETWDGRDAGGKAVASGTYFIRLEGGNQTLTRKAVLLR